jgi:predicted outer membrane repeat protein
MKWLAVVVCLVGLAWGAAGARAADAVVGNGTAASCTEAAFDAALATAQTGGGTITFNCGPAVATIPFSVFKTVTLGNVTIDGGGRIILNANNNDRFFFAGNGVTFRLRAITLRDGSSLVGGGAIEASGADVILENVELLNNYAAVSGGAIYCYDGTLTITGARLENNAAATGGAIYNDGCDVGINGATFIGNEALDTFGRGGAIAALSPGEVRLHDSLVQGNRAADGGGLFVDSGASAIVVNSRLIDNEAGHGGGLENSGAATITHSLIEGNSVTGSGGGVWNLNGRVSLTQTTVRNNTAYEGGGVNSYGSHVEMDGVNVAGNVATGTHGGGIYHGGGTLFIDNATISGNMADATAANGGGIYQNADGNLTLTNVTLAENTAGNFGGGLYHYGRYAVLTNVTIADNAAGVAGDALYEESPMSAGSPGVIQMVNSVILGSANNCGGGLFDSLGHNISRGTCPALSAAGDRENFAGDLRLGPLMFNGGAPEMHTRLPRAGSPLINAADPTHCRAHDQRGRARVGVCDIGAVEYEVGGAFRLYGPVVIR